jgi:hypothetical protein
MKVPDITMPLLCAIVAGWQAIMTFRCQAGLSQRHQENQIKNSFQYFMHDFHSSLSIQ